MLTTQEKQACEELYFAIAGGRVIQASRWNQAAAVELFKMLQKMKSCSSGVVWLVNLPSSIPRGWTGLASVGKLLYKVWQTKKAMEKDGKGLNPRCMESHFLHHDFLIGSALIGM